MHTQKPQQYKSKQTKKCSAHKLQAAQNFSFQAQTAEKPLASLIIQQAATQPQHNISTRQHILLCES